MKKYIKQSFILATSLLFPATAHAQVDKVDFTSNLPAAVSSGPDVGTLIGNVVNILFFVLGAGSVITIIVGGIIFATSAGNADRAKRGREAVIYAVIGLVISLSAVAIVTFLTNRLK